MKKALFSIVLLAVFSLFTLATYAQGTITGVVVDAESGEALIGASVVVDGTTTGGVTDINGSFSLSIPAGDQKISISFIGYTSQLLNVKVINGQTKDLMQIQLNPDAVGINEVMVLASVAVARKTPVAVSAIEPQQIAEKLGTQEYPEILKSTPGVYATRQGGGYGDARINIRGFSQRNVAVMINGVPVNDMENGWVYWSNWAGLSDVTRSMQVQRGLGASKLSTGSIGGTMNIITKTTDAERGGNVATYVGNDGYKKNSFALSTGLTENGWAISLSGAHTTREGWVDAAWADGWSYFASISKRWTNQMLTFTIFGAKQEHGQRSGTQSIQSVQLPEHGLRYNPEWGYKDGQLYNLRKNFYHKPQMSLNHYLTINDKATLATSVYYSFGTGGGTGGYGENQNAFYNYKKEEQIDFDRIVQENVENGNGGSLAVIRNSRNDHNWMGIISNLQQEIGENYELSLGIDFRRYLGKHFREVEDLMGGRFVYSDEDVNNPDKIARKGDKIGYWNDGLVSWQGLFAQLEYSKNDLSAFVAASFNNQGSKRVDYFNYLDSDPEQSSDWQNHQAFVVKGGANYNLNQNHNVFGNIGYFERAPNFDAIFINYRNDVNEGAKNEKTFVFELGYGYRTKNFNANVNTYYTNWQDKYFSRSFYDPGGDRYQANISGVNSLHKGLEIDFKWNPVKRLYLSGFASLGHWEWQDDLVDVPIYNDEQEQIASVDLFISGLKVGDAAQTTFALGADYEILDGFKLGLDWNHYDNYYAEFDPLGRGNEEDKTQSWKIPAYSLIDANLVYNFKMGPFDAVLFANVINLLDTEFISDADDGPSHDWDTAKVYYGIGRNWSTGLKINF